MGEEEKRKSTSTAAASNAEEIELNETFDTLSVATAEHPGELDETDNFSTDLLKIESTSCLGCIERLPLWLKLISVGLVSLLGLVVMGIFALAERSSTLSSAVFTSSFIDMTRSLNNATLYVSREAAAACMLSNSPNNSTRYNQYTTRSKETDVSVQYAIANLNLVKQIDPMSRSYNELQKKLQVELPEFRQLLLQKNGSQIAETYSEFANALQTMLNTLISSDLGKGVNSLSYVSYAKLNQKNGYMHYVGVLRAGNWSSTEYLMLAQNQRIERDSFNSFFQQSLNADGSSSYSSILQDSHILQRQSMENTLLRSQTAENNRGRNGTQQNQPNQPGRNAATATFTDTDWDSICTSTATVYQKLEDTIATKLRDTANSDLTRLITTLVALLILLVFFSLSSCFCTALLSKTIVGPWVRLNQLQEDVVSKFVPSGFLHSMGWRKITDVQHGKCVEKTVSILVAIIGNFQELTTSLGADELFKHMNKFLDFIESPIRNNAGYVDKNLGETIIILFPKSGRAFRAAFEVFEAVNTFNKLHVDVLPVQLSCSLHSGKSILGAMGSNKRMEGVCIGRPLMIAQRLAYYANKSRSSLLTTSETLGSLSLSKGLYYRLLGNVQLGNICTTEVVEVITKFQTAKMKSRNAFSNAVRQLHGGDLEAAASFFAQMVKESEASGDFFASKFLHLATKQLEKNMHIQRQANIYQILADPYLFDEFSKFCATEHSSENVNLYKAISQFKKLTNKVERKQQAQHIYNEYLRLDGKQSANITQQTYEHIRISLETENEVAAFQDDNLFAQVQAACETNLSDSMRRFRSTPKFFHHFLKSSLAVRVSSVKL